MYSLIEIALMLHSMEMRTLIEDVTMPDFPNHKIIINTSGGFSYYIRVKSNTSDMSYFSIYCYQDYYTVIKTSTKTYKFTKNQLQDIKDNFIKDNKILVIDFILAYGKIYNENLILPDEFYASIKNLLIEYSLGPKDKEI